MMTTAFGSTLSGTLRRFWSDEEGATLVEYVLLVALIAAVAVGTITTLGTNVNTKLTTASNALK
jgi:pilus assembly protein Flp/PilA